MFHQRADGVDFYFSNFDSLKSTETPSVWELVDVVYDFSNFDSLKSTETPPGVGHVPAPRQFQQFRLVEEY